MLYRCWLCVVLLLPFVISSRNSLHAALCCFSHQPGLSALPPVTAATPAPAIGIQPQFLSLLAAATCRWCARRVLLTTAIHTVACRSPVSAGGALYLHTSRRSAVGATGLQHHAGQWWGPQDYSVTPVSGGGCTARLGTQTSSVRRCHTPQLHAQANRRGEGGGGGSSKDEMTIFKNYDKTVG